MSEHFTRIFLFLVCSTIQISFADAGIIPSEEPKNCIRTNKAPCAVSTGDRAAMFHWGSTQWELDRNLVLEADDKNQWSLYQGLMVVQSKENLKIHTPFADVFLGRSKVMIHVIENKVRVLSLDGEPIRVKMRAALEEELLVPGFQNWYGGIQAGEPTSGVASVIDFNQFSKQRAQFFMDHSLGFIHELELVASRVKWAAQIASKIHRDLVERRIASMEESQHQLKRQKKQKVEYDKYLRSLFLKKIRYDY